MKDNFSYFSLKPYVVTPHLNHLVERVRMRGRNIMLLCRINKNYPKLSPNTEGSQHMLLCRINKNNPELSPNTPSYLELKSILTDILVKM